MHNDRKLIEDRVARTLHERLRREIHTPIAHLELGVWHVDGGLVDVIHGEPVSPEHALGQEYTPAQLGDAWGPAWSTSWYHLSAKVPPVETGQTVEAIFNLGFGDIDPGFHAEGMVYLPDGSVVKALNPKNQWIPVNQQTAPNGRFEVYVEAAANPRIASPDGYLPTLIGDKLTSGPEPLYRLSRADINLFDVELWELCQDLETLSELSRELADTDARRYQILRALERSLDAIDLQDVHATAAAARAELVEVLNSPAVPSAHRISAIGHAHIDSAWLWPLRETVRKVGRTSANVVNLLENNTLSGADDFRFAMSQAQQLAWLRDHRPDVFARVKELVRQGRFIPVGGMWVEPDTNMPGSEAMARQFVYGKRFFLEEFGIETEEVWLPDTFGYSAALPQIVKAAGAKWFLTQKISWNTVNKFPHHTFNWEGIDGTQIFTHFPPVDTYSSDLSGGQLAHAARNFQEKGAASHSLAPFGWGDGGGGPTREMLARVARNKNLEGAPRLSVESPADFFRAAEQEYQNPPVWVGELYLEFHRGTYTTQAKNKLGNRRSEHLLYEAELWSATAALRLGFEYPYDVLCRIWKQVLLLQFHDILPGTSIAWVHREAAETYAAIDAELNELIARAQQALAAQDASEGSEASAAGALVFNAAPQERDGIPALSARWVPDRQIEQTAYAETDGWRLQNEHFIVRLDRSGLFSSIYDLDQQREVLAGPGNLFQLHPDFPNDWDAWDIDEFYRNTAVDLVQVDSIQLDGPSSLLIRRSFGESSIEQRVSLAAGSREIVLDVEVSWFEKEKLLKLAFPLDLQAERSTAEIQFGHLQRPTHSNTSWDAAKFEICAHRWLRVEEPGYGVTLSNSATYGYDVTRQPVAGAPAGQPNGTTIRASLLRAPRFPDPYTDQGVHRMKFALLPGSDVQDAVRAGYAINLPERRLAGSSQVDALVSLDNEAVVISALKLADDQSGDLVLRLYESTGGRSRAALKVAIDYAEVVETDLLERPVPAKALSQRGQELELQLRPFQIVTLRFRGPKLA